MVSPRVDLTSKTHTNRNLKKNNWNKNSQVTRIKWLVFLTYTHARTHTHTHECVNGLMKIVKLNSWKRDLNSTKSICQRNWVISPV